MTDMPSSGQPIVLRGHAGGVFGAEFSPDGDRVLTRSGDNTARIWNTDGSGEPVALRGHEALVRSAVFSPDGAQVLTASDDKTARVWRLRDWGQLLTLLRERTTTCLTLEQRVAVLYEETELARARYTKCEERFGRVARETPTP